MTGPNVKAEGQGFGRLGPNERWYMARGLLCVATAFVHAEGTDVNRLLRRKHKRKRQPLWGWRILSDWYVRLALDAHGNAHAAADAQSREALLAVAACQFIKQCRQHARA